MPRRGWQSLDVPSGWVQVLRGPRPPSVKWPPAREGSRALSGPEVVAEDAVAEVKRLENAIQVLGETNPHAQPLVEALRVARAKTTVPPLQERIQSCKTFLERVRQRVARAESVIARTVEQKEIYVKEVSEGESRLQTLMSEEVSVPAHVSVPSDVQELQRQIDELRRERDLWRAAQTQIPRELQGMWCADGPSSVREIPPMPTDHQELVARLDQRTQLRSQERIGVLRQCHSCEDGVSHQSGHSTARGGVAGRGHGRVDQISINGIVDRRVRCEKKAGARCQHVGVAVHGGEPSVRNSDGLRGVRVGEASHPGPPQVQDEKRVVDSGDDVLTSLEHELTVIDLSSHCTSASGLLHRQSDVLDALEQDLCEAPSQGVGPTPSVFARGDVEISSGEEVLQRPNVDRDVAARICRSAEHLRPTSVDSELSSFCEDHPEAQFSQVSIVPPTPVAVVGGRSADPSTPVAVPLQNRFAPLEAPRASRRLVLIRGGGSSQFASWSEPSPRSVEVRDEPVSDVVGEVEESDTESLPWSIAGDEEVVPHTVEDRVVDVGLPRNVVLRMTLSLFDDVDTSVVFRQRAAVMRTVPISCAVHTGMS